MYLRVPFNVRAPPDGRPCLSDRLGPSMRFIVRALQTGSTDGWHGPKYASAGGAGGWRWWRWVVSG